MTERGDKRQRGRTVALAVASSLVVAAAALSMAPAAEALPAQTSPVASPFAASALVGMPVVGAPVTPRLRLPARPAVAARPNAIASAASAALWSLWYGGDEFETRLDRLVPLVAEEAEVSATDLGRAWASASRERMVVLLSALTQVGVPYRKFQSAPGKAFDCSGLTSWAWSQVGVFLPRQSLKQIRMVRRSTKAAVQPGDLLYYPGHVMLALGVGQAMIHAPNRGAAVRVSPAIARRVQWMRVGSPVR
jgi:cell wall-associated NlpC family hydrolase